MQLRRCADGGGPQQGKNGLINVPWQHTPSRNELVYLQGAFASRMSHSCTPNCQAVVMACNGRLTIAVYTLRYVQAGEELTFDYSSVTESEREFRCTTGRLTHSLASAVAVPRGTCAPGGFGPVFALRRAAICLCGTRNCRGSFLYFAGNKAFMQILNTRHTMLHRQAILLRASTEKVVQQDRELLEVLLAK